MVVSVHVAMLQSKRACSFSLVGSPLRPDTESGPAEIHATAENECGTLQDCVAIGSWNVEGLTDIKLKKFAHTWY